MMSANFLFRVTYRFLSSAMKWSTVLPALRKVWMYAHRETLSILGGDRPVIRPYLTLEVRWVNFLP